MNFDRRLFDDAIDLLSDDYKDDNILERLLIVDIINKSEVTKLNWQLLDHPEISKHSVIIPSKYNDEYSYLFIDGSVAIDDNKNTDQLVVTNEVVNDSIRFRYMDSLYQLSMRNKRKNRLIIDLIVSIANAVLVILSILAKYNFIVYLIMTLILVGLCISEYRDYKKYSTRYAFSSIQVSTLLKFMNEVLTFDGSDK